MRILLSTIAFITLTVISVKGQESLSLSKAIAVGLENNYNIEIYNKNYESSKINNSWGAAGRYPSFNFNLGTSASKSINEGRDNDIATYSSSASVDMNWTIFDGFSVNITKEQLATTEELSGGQSVVLIENTTSDIISAWYGALVELKKVDVAKDLLKISEDRYKQTEHSKELGVQTTYELLQAKNAYLEDKSNLQLQKMSYRNYIRNINYLMGVDGSTAWVLDGELSAEGVEFNYSDLEAKMLDSNSTVKNQYINQKLLEQTTRLRSGDLLPTLSLSGGISGTHTNSDSPFSVNGFSANPNASLNLSYNLFNGGNRKRAVQVAEINEEIGVLQIEDLELSLKSALLSELDNYEVRKEILDLADEQLKAAALNLSISKDKYKSGTINSFNFRDVQILYQNAAISKLNAELLCKISYIELLRLTGGIMAEIK